MKIQSSLLPEKSRKQKPTDVLKLSFGTVFTDHMFMMDYRNGNWLDPRVVPYGPLSIDPAALVLHYCQGIFEGLKAYRRGDRVLLFRPEKNIERLNKSAARMVMPTLDPGFALDSLLKLVRIERDWVPQVPGSSLYIRPTLIGTEPKLGVKAANEYLYYVILSPVGPYFPTGFGPVKIMVADKHVRAAEGGVGAAKTMGNYAAGLLAGKEAAEAGCTQVLWLDAHERRYLEEVGTMNIAVKFDDEVATPPLSGTILPGITRESVLHILRDWGLRVNEREISIDEVIEGLGTGRVEEILGCGTAAIIAPVGSLYYKGVTYTVGDGNTGPLTQRLYDELIGVQSGEREDKYNWVVEVS
ncbi:MAG: branched-chain amino acid aminotransferase [Candidatus Thorarchaeota archaeon]|nr:MAG: branched-chain amino acid aminotransferase [Candidatus Thorarchaeota archaeon]